MTGQAGRASSLYATALGGQQAQAGENLLGVQSQSDRVKAALDAALAQEGLFQQSAASAQGNQGQQIQNALGQGNLALGNAQLTENQRQANQQMAYLYSMLPKQYLDQISGWL